MEILNALVAYCQQHPFNLAASVIGVLCVVLTKLVTRYYDRKAEALRRATEEACLKKGVKPPPHIPFPPE